jgi:hypothetical protein
MIKPKMKISLVARRWRVGSSNIKCAESYAKLCRCTKITLA